MMIAHLTFQLIPLAFGFGVGYWLLINANNQDGATKTIGQILAGILIVMATILAMFSCYNSVKFARGGYMHDGYHHHKMMRHHENGMKDNSEMRQTPKDEDIQKNENNNKMDNETEDSPDSDDQPVNRNIKDQE